jgi:hypothetical protein
MSELFQEMCDLLQVKKVNSSSFNPQMQGKVEKFHLGLNQSMSHCVNKYGNDWDEFVNYALMAHRAVPHSPTRYSPFYLLYGREMRLPAEDDLTPEKSVAEDCASRRDSLQHHLETLAHRLKEAHQVVRENRIGQERQEYYDIGKKLVAFQPGDMVYLKEIVNSRRKCAKFRVRWKGLYEVMRRLSDLNYLVKLSRTKEIVINVNKTKKCFRQTTLRPTTQQRSTRIRAEDKLETLEMYGTRYTRLDSDTPHLDATEKNMTGDSNQDTDRKTYHHSRTRASSCGEAEVQVGGSASPRYPMGNKTGEYHRDVGDSPK